jgi:hypothetical protein
MSVGVSQGWKWFYRFLGDPWLGMDQDDETEMSIQWEAESAWGFASWDREKLVEAQVEGV